jgi:flagellar biosynthesis chaperone FliJ
MAFKKGSKEAKLHMAKVRASKISGVKKKAVAKKTTTRKKAVAKKPVNISYDNSWGKYLDSNKRAKPAGKRISAEGNVYYEYRRNRTDANQRAKKGQMLGTYYEDIRDILKNRKGALRERYIETEYFLSVYEDALKKGQIDIKLPENKMDKALYTKYNNDLKKLIKELKTHLKEIKKLL